MSKINKIDEIKFLLEDNYNFSLENVNIKNKYSDDECVLIYEKLLKLFEDYHFFDKSKKDKVCKINLDYINDEFLQILLSSQVDNFFKKNISKINFKALENLRLDLKVYNEIMDFVKNILLKENFNNSIYKFRNDFNTDSLNLKICDKFNIEILRNVKKITKDIGVNDFLIHFNKRFDYYQNLLSKKINFDNVLSVDLILELKDEIVDVFGLVYDIRETKKGYLIEVEDKSGKIKVFFNNAKLKEKEIIKNLVLDEGVYIKGKKADNDIIWGDVIVNSQFNLENKVDVKDEVNSKNLNLEDDVYSIFLGSLSVGSSGFMYKEFDKFIDFLSSSTKSDKLNQIAKKIKYIFITGDLISSLNDLNSLFYTFEFKYFDLARILSKIPKDKCVVVVPGESDFLRKVLPQNVFDYEDFFPVYNLENVLVLSNPSRISIFDEKIGFKYVLDLFSSNNFDYFANQISFNNNKNSNFDVKSLDNNFLEVGKFLKLKNHLSPSFQAYPFFPNTKNDDLTLLEDDVFVFSGCLKVSVLNYNGGLIFGCGVWNRCFLKDGLEKNEDRGQGILFNLKTKKVNLLNF